MAGEKGLSLCVVTCNDEKYLPDCLCDLKDSVDEIIVADIGSNDQTVALARRAGAHVFEFDWQDSFSGVKNFCMERAAGRWLLFLQANETLSGPDLKRLPVLLKNPNAEGYLLRIAGVGGLKMISPNSRLRLIRNRREYRFRYNAFEQIPDAQMSNIEHADIIVQRRGSEASWDAPMRIRLLEQDIAKHPKAHYINYVYGLSLFRAGEHEESAVYFENACDGLNPECLFATHLHECRGWSLLHLARYSEALTVLDKAIENFPLYTDFFVLRAEAHKQLDNYHEAICDLKRCLNTMKQHAQIVPAPEINAAVVWQSLGTMLAHLANLRQALACFQQAYYVNSRNSGLFEKLCTLAVEAGMPEALSGILGITLKQNMPRQLVAAAGAFFELGQYEKALGIINRVSDTGFAAQALDIKFNCRLMMEKNQSDQGCSNVDGAGNPRTLFEQIKRCWLRGAMPEAEELLKELAQPERMNPSCSALYHLMQRQLSGDAPPFTGLTPAAYREIGAVHNMLLFDGQTEKAKALLPLLLSEQGQDFFIDLAVLWARFNDFDVLKQIFEAVAQEETRSEFKHRVLKKLLYDRHLKTAEKLLYLGALQPSEEMRLALWSARRTKKLEEISRYVRESGLLNRAARTPPQPENFKVPLAGFFTAIHAQANTDSGKKMLTHGEMQAQIGVFFEGKRKRLEASAAYLRALQWEPNQMAQEKICAFSREDPRGLDTLLERLPWPTEDGLFHTREGFAHYIRGLVSFGSTQFEQALSMFAKAGRSETNSPAYAYMLVTLWLQDHEEAANALLNDIEESVEIWAWCFEILKNYILKRLEKALKQNPYNGLLLGEKESVLSQAFLAAV